MLAASPRGSHSPSTHHCYGHRLNLPGTGWPGQGKWNVWLRVGGVEDGGWGWLCNLWFRYFADMVFYWVHLYTSQYNMHGWSPFTRAICHLLSARMPSAYFRIWAFNADFLPELCALFWAKMSLFTLFWETVGHYFLGVVGHQILPNVYFCSRHAPGNMTTCTGVWWECGDVRVSRDNHRTRWLPAAHT